MLVVIIGILAVSIAIPVNRANRQRRAVERLKAVSGIARYDYEEWPGDPPPKLAWLRRLLGIHYFDSANIVFFIGSKPKPSDLKILADLPTVRTLNIEQSALPGEALRELPDLPNLRSVSLGRTNATDAALEQLSHWPQLQSITVDFLNTGGVEITDGGLAHLSKLGNLTVLRLNGCNITDAGLVHLRGLRQLQELTLYDTLTTQTGVDELQKALPGCLIETGKRKPGRATP